MLLMKQKINIYHTFKFVLNGQVLAGDLTGKHRVLVDVQAVGGLLRILSVDQSQSVAQQLRKIYVVNDFQKNSNIENEKYLYEKPSPLAIQKILRRTENQ